MALRASRHQLAHRASPWLLAALRRCSPRVGGSDLEAAALVDAVDQRAVELRDGLALQLHRRGELAVLLAEVAIEDRDAADLLDVGELLVAAPHRLAEALGERFVGDDL